MLKKCKGCGEEKEHHGKGYCYACYKKFIWKPKIKICKRCGREMSTHAKDLCPGCYNFVFHLDKNKAWNQKKNYGIDFDLYKKITSKCIICGFNNLVDLHHLDENKNNNFKENLIGLCPNHHQMLHSFKFRKEIRDSLKEKGYNFLEDKKLDFSLD